jgi:phage-related minor tail protein
VLFRSLITPPLLPPVLPEEANPAKKLSQWDIGVAAGLEKIKLEIFNFSTAIESAMVNAFHGAEDAVVEFVTTGKLNVKAFVSSILADLTRVAFRQMLSGALGMFGVKAPAPTATLGGGRAEGGGTKPGKYYVVGEHGPELFNPGVQGTVTPIQRSEPAKVTVINVQSMEMALAAMRSTEGQRIIVNANKG